MSYDEKIKTNRVICKRSLNKECFETTCSHYNPHILKESCDAFCKITNQTAKCVGVFGKTKERKIKK